MIKKLNNRFIAIEQVTTESGNLIWKFWHDSFCRVIERSKVGGVVGSEDRVGFD